MYADDSSSAACTTRSNFSDRCSRSASGADGGREAPNILYGLCRRCGAAGRRRRAVGLRGRRSATGSRRRAGRNPIPDRWRQFATVRRLSSCRNSALSLRRSSRLEGGYVAPLRNGTGSKFNARSHRRPSHRSRFLAAG